MPVKSYLLACILPVLLACNIQFDLPKSNEEVNTTPPPTAPAPTAPAPSASWENELLDLVNGIRRAGCRCGNKRMPPVQTVRLDTKLNRTAQVHANDMFRNRFFDHKGSDGSQVGDRATKAGFVWRSIGENISQGYPSVTTVFNGWKNSPGHCKNMMSPNFKFMGAAQEGSYWVQTFGSPM